LAQAIFEPNFFPYNTPHFFKLVHSSHIPACEDGTECSETSAHKIQTPGNYPEESIQPSGHGKSLKSRIVKCLRMICDVTYALIYEEFIFIFLLINFITKRWVSFRVIWPLDHFPCPMPYNPENK